MVNGLKCAVHEEKPLIQRTKEQSCPSSKYSLIKRPSPHYTRKSIALNSIQWKVLFAYTTQWRKLHNRIRGDMSCFVKKANYYWIVHNMNDLRCCRWPLSVSWLVKFRYPCFQWESITSRKSRTCWCVYNRQPNELDIVVKIRGFDWSSGSHLRLSRLTRSSVSV